MKKLLELSLFAFMLAALSLPGSAQDENSDSGGQSAPAAGSQGTAAAKKPAPRKPARKKRTAKKKKPARKKKKEEPVSEYKFSSSESVPTYKFDKRANPIVKKKKKPAKKKGAAAGKKGSVKPAARLKPAKPIGEEGAAQQDQSQQAQGQGGGQ